MEANVKIQSADKSAEKWQILAEKLKKIGCNYSRLQIIREGIWYFLLPMKIFLVLLLMKSLVISALLALVMLYHRT